MPKPQLALEHQCLGGARRPFEAASPAIELTAVNSTVQAHIPDLLSGAR
ncbi:hypothetical protein SF83666_b47350 (plasmid) [Sinorhizobium fredii CCBAU 83666]|nr:hypothetical protein SF83666_b47350 [Sinorhizobium fredii CCBAU 83666]